MLTVIVREGNMGVWFTGVIEQRCSKVQCRAAEAFLAMAASYDGGRSVSDASQRWEDAVYPAAKTQGAF